MEPAGPSDDLSFTPDDGHFEYYAVATNMALGLPALFAIVCGRGAQEKTLAELKGEFALDVVPTNHYGANSAWQQSEYFRVQCGPKLPARHAGRGQAGRLTRIAGRNTLRLSQNPATEGLYTRVEHALAA